MRRTLIAGNWKMNGSQSSIATLLQGIVEGSGRINAADLAVCPPAIYLSQVATALQGSTVAWGSQDVSEHAAGAYTGEIAVAMLQDLGCRYAIVGHSERRTLHGEDDATVARKAAAAIAGGITPIICIGETLSEREGNVTEQVCGRQMAAVIEQIGAAGLAKSVVAYEPVWAIGTGRTATPEQAQAVHAFVREQVRQHDAAVADQLQILYGGSMKPDNAAELLAQSDIDGGLIGGASLQADQFLAIAAAAS